MKSKKSKKKVNKKPRKVIHLSNPFEQEKSSQAENRVDTNPYVEELCVAGGESRYNVNWLISMLTVMKEI
jgi:hypothetical protein